jgi:hypothetical protein
MNNTYYLNIYYNGDLAIDGLQVVEVSSISNARQIFKIRLNSGRFDEILDQYEGYTWKAEKTN